VRILHLVSCRGWSSDAYWAARVCRELERRGHDVTLGCRRGTDAAVIDRARAEGVEAIETFEFAGGVRLASDATDLRRLARALLKADVVHVHRGKEHWLAVAAARLGGRPRPIVRTRHIAHAVRWHVVEQRLSRHAVRIDKGQTVAVGHVLHHHRFQQRRFTHPRLPEYVAMPVTFGVWQCDLRPYDFVLHLMTLVAQCNRVLPVSHMQPLVRLRRGLWLGCASESRSCM